jgi:hypothetical protein
MCSIASRRPHRSSIIVSDEPLSRETNYRTEFVAVLNNQPQGGFVTRRPTADVAVASGNFWGDDGLGSFFQPNWNSQTGNTRRRRPVLLSGATGLVVRRGTPRVGRMSASVKIGKAPCEHMFSALTDTPTCPLDRPLFPFAGIWTNF